MNYLDDMSLGELAQVTKALQVEPEGDEVVGDEEELLCEQK